MTFARKIFGLTPMALAFTLVASGVAEAKIKTVRVTAEVPVVEGDRARTLERAKREARRQAIEEGAGTLVESNTVVRNYQLVYDEIATSARGVLTDEQWGELVVDGNTAKITLTAKVSPEAVESAICTVMKANHDPRIALVFVEKLGKPDAPWKVERGVIETMFVEALMDACFTIVEPGIKVTEVSADGDIPQDAIEQIVKNTNAQYVLIGQARLVEAQKSASLLGEGPFNTYSPSVAFKLINVDTNVIEATGTKVVGNVVGMTPELAIKKYDNGERGKRLIHEVLDEIFQKIAKRWSSEMTGGSAVEVYVKNVRNYGALRALQKVTEGVFPKANLSRPRLRKGEATFGLEVEGGADEFAAQMEGKKVGKQTIEVLEVASGKVVLQLK